MINTVAPQILDTLLKSDHILLLSHEKPDGDTLGSSLALANLLLRYNKKYHHFCPDKPASYFSYLPLIDRITSDFSQITLADYDAIMAIDCGDIKRTGIENELLAILPNTNLINIDHHHSNSNYGHINLVMPKASSTTEIIYKLLAFGKIDIDKQMATSLLTGILTDTSNFTNAATNKDSLIIASELIHKGAKYNLIQSSLGQNKKMADLKLWGKVLHRLEHNERYNFAFTIIEKKDFEELQLNEEAIDGLTNFLSNIEGINFVMVLKEENDNIIKGSLRTVKDTVDVSQIAQKLNGGGHKKAAGFKISKPQTENNEDWKSLVINDIIIKLENLIN